MEKSDELEMDRSVIMNRSLKHDTRNNKKKIKSMTSFNNHRNRNNLFGFSPLLGLLI